MSSNIAMIAVIKTKFAIIVPRYKYSYLLLAIFIPALITLPQFCGFYMLCAEGCGKLVSYQWSQILTTLLLRCFSFNRLLMYSLAYYQVRARCV